MSPRARTATPPRVDETRDYADTYKVNGRTVEPGTELTVAGIRGRVVFRQYARHVNGAEWLDVVTSRGFWRAVRPEAVRRVHRTHRVGASV